MLAMQVNEEFKAADALCAAFRYLSRPNFKLSILVITLSICHIYLRYCRYSALLHSILLSDLILTLFIVL